MHFNKTTKNVFLRKRQKLDNVSLSLFLSLSLYIKSQTYFC